MKETFYVNPPRINTTSFMTVSELLTLQNYGHEIGSHGNNHLDLPTLTDSQMRQELQGSRQTLWSWGLTANNFAYPDGQRTACTDSIVVQYYRSARSWNVGPYLMYFPISQSMLPAFEAKLGIQMFCLCLKIWLTKFILQTPGPLLSFIFNLQIVQIT
jgi:peptidoglycan/xylan/chitin deacetylase (PgdA/CDA1 family)